MARILYGVSGEGSGHATRSKEILSGLVKKHRVKVLAYGKSYDLLKDCFDTQKIYGLHLYYRDGSVDYLRTALANLRRMPAELDGTLAGVKAVMKRFRPEVVISDFEPVSGLLARHNQLPLISLDNQHIFTNCDVKYPRRFAREAGVNRLVIGAYLPRISETLITCFYHPRVTRPDTYLFPPILRRAILAQKPRAGRHVLVYQTASGDDSIAGALKNCPGEYIFYGCNKDQRDGNITYRKFSEEGFIKDLASCRAVVCNGGLSLMSEALHLGKPIFSVPIAGQFEQIANAYYLEKLGYGRYRPALTALGLRDFLKNIELYSANLKKYPRADNSAIAAKLEELIAAHAGKIALKKPRLIGRMAGKILGWEKKK
ncbi:MAG: hypothetical protein A2X31_00155 [Elusimicrobia bacterium GWB2_63_22]|nr:MAG: hypothetical protein A2X31_00155 [Elusimicrobia bacterium GWB2_63_22]